jgi:hypothetical protein
MNSDFPDPGTIDMDEIRREVAARHARDEYRLENTRGARLIVEERIRQVEGEGWTPQHDDEHENGELARAGACYALWDCFYDVRPNHVGGQANLRLHSLTWPWDAEWWKPKAPIRNLVRAGALIAAEIDRRLRAGETIDEAPDPAGEES